MSDRPVMGGAVYLDHNATTPVRPAAAAALAAALARTGNPSSVHGFGRAARRAVDDARERVAALVGARPAAVVFTSGGTEANNLALRGLDGRRPLVSAVEHVSVLEAAAAPETVPVDGDGVVDLAALESLLAADPRPAVVSVMLANNETGVIQPVGAVAALARRFGAVVHCDAVQAAGKIAVAMADLGVDLLTLSAHKLGGPQGVGALVVGPAVELSALARGGGQERGRRAGTEGVALIVGFGVAAEIAADEPAAAARRESLRDRLEARVLECCPRARVFGAGAPRLPNTSCFATPGARSETLVMGLDLAGVAVSAGSACSSGKVRASHVLAAMGAAEAEAAGAIRVSLGWPTTGDDVDRFIQAWGALYRRLGSPAAAAPAA